MAWKILVLYYLSVLLLQTHFPFLPHIKPKGIRTKNVALHFDMEAEGGSQTSGEMTSQFYRREKNPIYKIQGSDEKRHGVLMLV